jgi:hypothetical protein
MSGSTSVELVVDPVGESAGEVLVVRVAVDGEVTVDVREDVGEGGCWFEKGGRKAAVLGLSAGVLEWQTVTVWSGHCSLISSSSSSEGGTGVGPSPRHSFWLRMHMSLNASK